jgi:hypothetical protein
VSRTRDHSIVRQERFTLKPGFTGDVPEVLGLLFTRAGKASSVHLSHSIANRVSHRTPLTDSTFAHELLQD